MQWWLSCCGATNSTKLAQRQIMMCGATKLRRQREQEKNFAFGENTQYMNYTGISGPQPIRGGSRPSLSLIGLDHDMGLMCVCC